MFRGLKNLLLVGILFYGINVGVAQGQQQQQGQAYEFSGLSRFIAPSQLLFGNNVWRKSDVINGYPVEDWATNCTGIDLTGFIALSQEETKWWRQPIYEVIPKEERDSAINNTTKEVFFLDPKEELKKSDCVSGLENKKFVVDSNILTIIDELSILQEVP